MTTSSTDADQKIVKLEQLFRSHLLRDDPRGHFIDLNFRSELSDGAHYQYLNGLHNLTGLDKSTAQEVKEIAEETDLRVEAGGDNFVTLTWEVDPTPEAAEQDAAFCEHLLEKVYGVTLDDVKSAKEEKGNVGWK